MEQKSGKLILPDSSQWFKAFLLTPHDKVRVVILGQDPYPGYDNNRIPYANGLAFSVTKGCVPLPPSLVNIFQELVDDIGCPKPVHGDLTKWAQQGVLLLNTSLTVEAGKPASHKDIGWFPLIKETIESLPNRVWILWGKHAQSFSGFIPEPRLVIQSPHPSPYSARTGFFGSKPFSMTNNIMLGEDKIDWSID